MNFLELTLNQIQNERELKSEVTDLSREVNEFELLDESIEYCNGTPAFKGDTTENKFESLFQNEMYDEAFA